LTADDPNYRGVARSSQFDPELTYTALTGGEQRFPTGYRSVNRAGMPFASHLCTLPQ
jgi:hypothetical protein